MKFIKILETLERPGVKATTLVELLITWKIEDNELKENLSWAEEEERKEIELLQKQREEAAAKAVADEAWMDSQIEEEKKVQGEDFGDDLSIDFKD